MFTGWMGLDLDIDLSTGNIERSEGDLSANHFWLGGRSIGAKMVWDRIAPETRPFSPQNLLIFNTGSLTGTLCPGANRTIVSTRSPQNNLYTYSSYGGFWGPELKFAGYDSLVVSGKAPHPVYIYIKDDVIEIRDARHLWGKDCYDTQFLLKQELDDLDVQVTCIGQAGENRVHFAALAHAQGASASRAGIGAIMGDKNLKAIVVRGTKDVKIAKPEEFYALSEELLMLSAKEKVRIDDVSHTQTIGLIRAAPWGNFEFDNMQWLERGDEHAAALEKHSVRRPGCFNCQIGCRRAVKVPGGKEYSYAKCVSHYAFIPAFKIDDFEFNFRAFELVERLGLDTMSLCAVAPFAIDLYEKGIITNADTDGFELKFGDAEVALKLIEQIGTRQGIGEVMADGVLKAAQRIGRGAEQYAYHIKGLEPLVYPHQFAYIGMAAAVADRPDATRQISYVPQHLVRMTDEFKADYLQSPFWGYPETWKNEVLEPWDPTGGDTERLSKMISRDRDEINLSDCTGLCTFWTDFAAYSPIKGFHVARLHSYATGMDIDEEEALHRSARSGALIRAYNAMLGISRKDDTAPNIFFEKAAAPKFPALDRAKFDRFVDAYYKLRGWTARGIPSKEKLAELELPFVAEELERRGLYAETDSLALVGV